jgi:hypothetical protein
MVIIKEKDYSNCVKKARLVAHRFAGSWGLEVFKSHLSESLARLEKQDRRYDSAAQYAAWAASGRQYRTRLGSVLARLLLEQAADLQAGQVYEKASQHQQQVFKVRVLRRYSFKVRQLAGLLQELTVTKPV